MRRSIGSVTKYSHPQTFIHKSENSTNLNLQNNQNLDKKMENFSTACFPSNSVNPQNNEIKK